MSAITEAVAQITSTVPGLRNYGIDTEAAVIECATVAVESARRARSRIKPFDREMNTEQLEDIAFLGSVAQDILDGAVSRPSTGNVRQYAISLH